MPNVVLMETQQNPTEISSAVAFSERTLGNSNSLIRQVCDSTAAKSLPARDSVLNLKKRSLKYCRTAQTPDMRGNIIISSAYYMGHA